MTDSPALRLLADESLHAGLVAWLRSRSEDVLAVAETFPGASDEDVLRSTTKEGRIVISDDKDFGELVVHRGRLSPGVLLLRLRSPTIGARIARLNRIWTTVARLLPGHLVVVSERTIRARPIPGPESG